MNANNLVFNIYCDGGARGNPGPAAAAFVVEASGKIIHKGAKFLGQTTNNVAEYSAVILALTWAKENLAGGKLKIILDSELVAKQMAGQFKVKNENLRGYFLTATELEKKLGGGVSYVSVSRDKNKIADFLVNKVLDKQEIAPSE